MNYAQIGKRIRKIRETELNKTMEEFAEALDISIHTVSRLENANSNNIRNVEIYLKICELTGYTMEELLLDKQNDKTKEKIKKRINYLLNVISEDELEYIYISINQFVKFNNRNQITTLKDIKKKINNKKEITST